MNLIKIGGLLLILISSSFLGFYKSQRLIKRSRSLDKVCISLEKLLGLIKCGTGDLDSLLKLSFGHNVGRDYVLNFDGLNSEDRQLFYKMITEMGISQREKEQKTVLIYITLFQKRLAEAEAEVNRLAKLYNSLGILIGLSICIFLI